MPAPAGPKEWSRAESCKKQDNIQSHVLIKAKKFKPSYEKEGCEPIFSWLLGNEYGRIWLRERNEFLKNRKHDKKPKRIKNDYQEFLAKRVKKEPKPTCTTTTKIKVKEPKKSKEPKENKEIKESKEPKKQTKDAKN